MRWLRSQKNRRQREIELAYAALLTSNPTATKQGVLSIKLSIGTPERWIERHVSLRGDFISVGKPNQQAQAKLFRVAHVEKLYHSTFTVLCTTGEGLVLRAQSPQDKEAWVFTIREILQNSDCIPNKENRMSLSHRWERGTQRQTSLNSSAESGKPCWDAEDTVPPMKDTCEAPFTSKTLSAGAVFRDSLDGKREDQGDQEQQIRAYSAKQGSAQAFTLNNGRNASESIVNDLRSRQRGQAGTSTTVIVSHTHVFEGPTEISSRETKVTVIHPGMDKAVSLPETASFEHLRASPISWNALPLHFETSPKNSGTDRNLNNNKAVCTAIKAPVAAVQRALGQGLGVVRESNTATLLLIANVVLVVLLVWIS